jgi:hypothetical protein
VTVVQTFYFDYVRGDLFYSTEACGEGADDFGGWFEAAGDVGDTCRLSSECFGPDTVCDNSENTCNCRFSPHASDCTAWNAHRIWGFTAYLVSAIAYVSCALYLCACLAHVPARFAHEPISRRCEAGIAPLWGVLSTACLLFEQVYKMMAVLGHYDFLPWYVGKSSYDVTTNVADALGTVSSPTRPSLPRGSLFLLRPNG